METIKIKYKDKDTKRIVAIKEGDWLDIAANATYEMKAGEFQIIDLGVAMEIPEWYWGAVYARSGLATKQGLRPANCVGVIDSHYRGPIIVAIHNDSNNVQIIHHGDRIAQFMLAPVIETSFEEVSELSDSDRGEGGFGSSGK